MKSLKSASRERPSRIALKRDAHMRNLLLAGAAALALIHPAHAQRTIPFQQGFADRQQWEEWFASLSGDTKAGAEFWAGQRSLPHPGACFGPTGQDLGGFTAGCLGAQQRLSPMDARRKSEPDYKAGFNAWVPGALPDPQQVASNAQTIQQGIDLARQRETQLPWPAAPIAAPALPPPIVAPPPAYASLTFPYYNVPAHCQVSPSWAVGACLDVEYIARSRAASIWPSLPVAVQHECIDAGNLAGSYDDLDTCIKGNRGDVW